MSGGATKAAPREKQVAFQSQRYKVTETVHFINGRLHQPGDIVVLPEGVKPGKKLIAVGNDGEPSHTEQDAAQADAPKPDSKKK